MGTVTIGLTIFAVLMIVVAFLLGRYLSGTTNKANTINVPNTERRFGSLTDYRGVILDGEWHLFSPSALLKAKETALKNQEDIANVTQHK